MEVVCNKMIMMKFEFFQISGIISETTQILEYPLLLSLKARFLLSFSFFIIISRRLLRYVIYIRNKDSISEFWNRAKIKIKPPPKKQGVMCLFRGSAFPVLIIPGKPPWAN